MDPGAHDVGFTGKLNSALISPTRDGLPWHTVIYITHEHKKFQFWDISPGAASPAQCNAVPTRAEGQIDAAAHAHVVAAAGFAAA